MNKNEIGKDLDGLRSRGLIRKLREQTSTQDKMIRIDGRDVLNFCSNNYLGLANDPRLTDAAKKELDISGLGAGASRLISGNMKAHVELEKKIADLKGTEACLLFNSGYAANTGIIPAICGRGDVVFCDKLNHASIIDGILLSRARLERYQHCDMNALESLLKNYRQVAGRRLIVTDTVFSMDGDIAPLDKIVELAKKNDCLLMTDEAHGFGVLGDKGAGAGEMFHVSHNLDIQMGTLSKAAGCMGAYVCGSRELIEILINKARSFIYTTAMPPAIAAAASVAIDIIKNDRERRIILHKNADYIRECLREAGFNTMNSETAIIPVLIRDSALAADFSRRLLEKNIYVAAIRPPTVPDGFARLRLTVMATHTKIDIDKVVSAMRIIGKEMGII